MAPAHLRSEVRVRGFTEEGGTTMPTILQQLRDRIGTITLNRPERRNALNRAMLEEMTAAMSELRHDGARVIILRAPEGAEVWSAGYDIAELPDPTVSPLTQYDALLSTLQFLGHTAYPILAMIEGSVWGGACDLAMGCDILVGSPSARFTPMPSKVLIPYGASGLQRLIDLVGANTVKEMFFTGEPLSAERALQVGILNHLVPAGQLEKFTFGLAEKIAAASPWAVAAAKEEINLLTGAGTLAPRTLERIQELRQTVFGSQDYVEGLRAFREKRAPVFRESR